MTERMGNIEDCEHGYRAAGGSLDCPACEADRDAAEYWHGMALAADEQLKEVVKERDELRNMLIRVLDAVALLDHPQEHQ